MKMRDIPLVALAILVSVSVMVAMAGTNQQDDPSPEAQLEALQDLVRRLSYNTASGGGVNVKMMPHPETGEMSVPLPEVFSFDRNHALCRVDTNPEAFVMPTHEMGDVLIEPHQFFMSMVVTTNKSPRSPKAGRNTSFASANRPPRTNPLSS